jgi:hypothetical protein
MTIRSAHLNSLAPVRYNKENDTVTVNWLKVWTYLAIGGIIIASATDVYASQTPHLPNPDPLPTTPIPKSEMKIGTIESGIENKLIKTSIEDLIGVPNSTDSKITTNDDFLKSDVKFTYFEKNKVNLERLSDKGGTSPDGKNSYFFERLGDTRTASEIIGIYQKNDGMFYTKSITQISGKYYLFETRLTDVGSSLSTSADEGANFDQSLIGPFLSSRIFDSSKNYNLFFSRMTISQVKSDIIRNGVEIKLDKDGLIIGEYKTKGITEGYLIGVFNKK